MPNWVPTTTNLPENTNIVIAICPNYPDPMLGYYDKDRKEWCIEIDGDRLDNPLITFWMEIPPIPETPEVKLWTANEMRYIQKIRKYLKDKNPDIEDVNEAIYAAAQRGESNCVFKSIDNNLVKMLKENGFTVLSAPDFAEITW